MDKGPVIAPPSNPRDGGSTPSRGRRLLRFFGVKGGGGEGSQDEAVPVDVAGVPEDVAREGRGSSTNGSTGPGMSGPGSSRHESSLLGSSLHGSSGSTASRGPGEAGVLESDEAAKDIDVATLVFGEEVGDGTTADVFKGEYKGTCVAIKRMCKMQHFNRREQVSFTRELAALEKLHHPNLVQFFGAYLAEHPFLIVMEFCGGGALFDLLYNTEIELLCDQETKICLDVAQGMQYLHTCDPVIVHRDLKSLNVLLEDPVTDTRTVPCAKVTDFGLSKMVEKSDRKDKKAKMTKGIGTVHWMAPEVFESSDYNEKVDVYSFAMLLYEVIAKEPPFDDANPTRIPFMVASGMRPSLEKCPPASPEYLVALMQMCWEHEAGDRPSFQKVVALLEDHVAK